MAKGKRPATPAEDYLEQIQWRSRHGRRWPVFYEPKWKYKIRYRHSTSMGLQRITGILLLIVSMVAAVSPSFSDTLTTGEKTFFSIMIGLAFLIVFFAIRDGSKDNDESDRE